MTFVAEGSLGTTSVKRTVGADGNVTTALSPSGDVDVGQLVVVYFAADNTHSVANPGSPNLYERLACHDSQGNHYSTVVANHSGAGGNQAAMGALFIARVARALDTADTITVTHRAVSGPDAGGSSAMSVEEFSCDPDLRWATTDQGPSQRTDAAADPGAISLSSLDSREYLMLHYLAAEGPDTDAYTWDTDYTEITGDGTTGGADASNIHIRGGYRIATLTTDTVDVSSDTSDRDYAQGLVAITEVNYDAEFPIEAVLDDFNRADEEPLFRDGDWETDNCNAGGGISTPRYLRVSSNQARGSTATGSGGSWYIDEVFQDPDGEVWVTVATPGSVSIAFNGEGCANLVTVDGLAAQWFVQGGPGNLNARDNIIFGGNGNQGGVDDQALRAWVDLAAGVKFGFQRRSPVQHLWIDVGNGWEWIAAIHANGGLAGYSTGGKLGLSAFDSNVRLDDFGGGPLFQPGFYRRLEVVQ